MPLRVLNGDVNHTAEGVDRRGFALEHYNVVSIKGDSISLWGACEKGDPEVWKKGILYLPLRYDRNFRFERNRSRADHDRRIITKVLRVNYGKTQP